MIWTSPIIPLDPRPRPLERTRKKNGVTQTMALEGEADAPKVEEAAAETQPAPTQATQRPLVSGTGLSVLLAAQEESGTDEVR